MGGTLTIIGVLDFLNVVSPLKHQCITVSGKEEGLLERSEAEDVLQLTVLQPHLQRDATPQIDHFSRGFARRSCLS